MRPTQEPPACVRILNSFLSGGSPARRFMSALPAVRFFRRMVMPLRESSQSPMRRPKELLAQGVTLSCANSSGHLWSTRQWMRPAEPSRRFWRAMPSTFLLPRSICSTTRALMRAGQLVYRVAAESAAFPMRHGVHRDAGPWPFAQALEDRSIVRVADLPNSRGIFPSGPLAGAGRDRLRASTFGARSDYAFGCAGRWHKSASHNRH